MDFMQLLRSLQEMLYEVMSWLVFYPRTLWKIVRHPATMTAVSDRELTERPEEQFTDTLAPPLFLLLSILLAYGLQTTMNVKPTELQDGGLFVAIAASPQNLVLYRAFIFALLPLIAAVEYLTRKKIPLNRDSLKPPFFSQCYLAGPFVLAVGTAEAFATVANQPIVIAAIVGGFLGLLWYGVVLGSWFRRTLGISAGRSALVSLKVLFLAFLTQATISSLLSVKAAV